MGQKPPLIWKIRNLQTAREFECSLIASWEVGLDPISDDYTPHEISAEALFARWVERVKQNYSDKLIPIYWSVQCESEGLFEAMPFQHYHYSSKGITDSSKGITQSDFLNYFSFPVNAVTGKRLNWLTLPVADRLWDAAHANKGGFIQQATGWKPSILQPYVFLDALVSTQLES